MSPELAYFVKVNVALMLFYAFYRLFFYKDTFFKLRRFILLVFFGLPFFYPLLNFQDWVKDQQPIAEVVSIYSAMLPETTIDGNVNPSLNWINIFTTLAISIYWIVVIFLCIRFIIQLGSIIWLTIKSKQTVINNRKIYVLNKPSGPFSFFRLIFLYPDNHSEDELEEIILHEYTHASQWHSMDVIIGELICIACWMNPFVWLLKREVRHNLEYLADHTVIESGCDSKSYQYHLLGLAHHTNQAAANLYNNFNVLHLKNRISMMNKERSRAIGRTKYLIFFPLVALLMLLSNIEAVARITKDLAATINTEEYIPIHGTVSEEFFPQPEYSHANQDKQKPYTVVDHMPRYPGGEEELLKFIATNIKYPKESQEKGIKGRVICNYVVNTDGSITDIEVIRGVDPLLDAEAVRVIGTMPKWIPGKHKGETVRVKYTIPIVFSLENMAKNATSKNVAKDKPVIEDNSDPNNPIYKIPEEMPKYPGGEVELLKYISQSIKYPDDAKQSKTEGRVIASFVVEKDGSLSNFKIVRGISPSLDNEALRVLKSMPKWTPGKVGNNPVRVVYTVPITYRVN